MIFELIISVTNFNFIKESLLIGGIESAIVLSKAKKACSVLNKPSFINKKIIIFSLHQRQRQRQLQQQQQHVSYEQQQQQHLEPLM